jgi:hypothetical protein
MVRTAGVVAKRPVRRQVRTLAQGSTRTIARFSSSLRRSLRPTRALRVYSRTLAQTTLPDPERHHPVVERKHEGLFVFRDDGEVFVLPSVLNRGDLETPEVEDGAYPAIYTLDAFLVEATTRKHDVVLTVTAVRDEEGLRRRLAALDPGFSARDDLVAYANRLLAADWEQRRPKRPTWLARVLARRGPPTV